MHDLAFVAWRDLVEHLVDDLFDVRAPATHSGRRERWCQDAAQPLVRPSRLTILWR